MESMQYIICHVTVIATHEVYALELLYPLELMFEKLKMMFYIADIVRRYG